MLQDEQKHVDENMILNYVWLIQQNNLKEVFKSNLLILF